MAGVNLTGSSVEARAPINVQRGREGTPRGTGGAPREVSTPLILIIPHGTARGAPLQNVAGPAFSELRGHPGGTWGFAYAVIAIGLRGTRGHPDSQHCGKYMARQYNTLLQQSAQASPGGSQQGWGDHTVLTHGSTSAKF